LIVITALGLLAMFWGCSQTDDVTAPRSVTKIWLAAERLPTPAPGMVYELWVSDTTVTAINDASDVQSLGRFSYVNDDTLKAFLDPATQTVRVDSNEFVLSGDMYDYRYLLVSVEREADVQSTPGPVMLMQEITGTTDTLRMTFPMSDVLWNATVRYNLEGVTDNNRWAADGYGLWFSTYQVIRWSITDTTSAAVTLVEDTMYPEIDSSSVPWDTLNKGELQVKFPDSVWFEFDTVYIDFGRDSLPLGLDSMWFRHIGAQQFVAYDIDSTWPRYYKRVSTTDIDSVVRSVTLDLFGQDDFGLPDYSAYGWKYQGWVVTAELPAEVENGIGKFTPPAWDYKVGVNLFPGDQGGLLTTGTFTHITQADDANPFTDVIEWVVDSGAFLDTVLMRPNLPGEDFFDTAAIHAAFGALPAAWDNGINLLPAPNGNTYGTVFITLEPDNRISDTTNSPLIIFSREFPQSYGTGGVGTVAFQNMLNWSGNVTGTNGLPKVTARISRL
jgi:hypothetical protein